VQVNDAAERVQLLQARVEAIEARSDLGRAPRTAHVAAAIVQPTTGRP